MKAQIKDIIDINTKCAEFWGSAGGWAPTQAADLLSKSRLDWQVSLSQTLYLWSPEDTSSMSDGSLILAWANLGALAEGTSKLLLSVYYMDYIENIETLKYANAYDNKSKKKKDPDGLSLDKLRKFFVKKQIFDERIMSFFELVQKRLNAIHAYEDRPLGNRNEFFKAVDDYLYFLGDVDGRLPYP